MRNHPFELVLLIITFVVLQSNSTAQISHDFQIQGVATDEKQNAIPYANVLLLNAADSSLIKGAITDTTGYFSFPIKMFGEYIIRISCLGFEPYYSEIIKESTGILKITLQASANSLNEVSVVVVKPFIEHHLDKLIVNVENSAVSGGNTALEVLEKSPGITVDYQNETIRMLNKSGVIVLVNGRQIYMSGPDLMQYLSTINAEQISRIEIITNPSSKYDAAGNAGIVNIILKKNMAFGTNGSISIAGGQGFLPDSRNGMYRGTSTLSISHRSKKIYLHSSLSLFQDASYSENNIYRTFNYNENMSSFDQKISKNPDVQNLNFRFGGDFYLSEKTTIGWNTDINFLKIQMEGLNTTSAVDFSNPNENFSISQIVTQNNPRSNFNSNLNLKHNFNDKGKTLSFDVDYLKYSFLSEQNFNASFYDSWSALQSQLIQVGNNTSILDVLAAKIDYEHPINETMKFEFGAKSSYVKIDSELKFEELINSNWAVDTGKSNHFIYQENINAIYINFQKSFNKFALQTGLRTENTNSLGNSITLNNTVKRNYVSIFPSLFTSYKLNENNTIKASYSRRLDRPGYDQLNPFIIVLDPYSYATGNPYLRPQFTNSVELGLHHKQHSIVFNYSRTNDLITELTIPNDSTRITHTIETNLNYVDDFSTSFNFNFEVKKFWLIYSQVIVFYKSFNDNNLLGGNLKLAQWMCYADMTNIFILPKKWRAEISGWYQSPFVEGIIVGRNHRFSINAGISKSFLKDKGRLKMSMSDIFLTSFLDGYVDYQNVHLTFQPRFTTRRLMLTFTYNFGSQTIKASHKNGTASDSEKERISQ